LPLPGGLDKRIIFSVTIRATSPRRFVPGTTGWTEDDLDDPRIERLWDRGAYEIVEGVLTRMPAAYLEGSVPLRRLVRQVERYLDDHAIPGEFAFEVDLVANQVCIPRVDAVFLTPDQLQQQAAIQANRPTRRPSRTRPRYGRLRVPPSLAIESISVGHELHDRQTKREWYCTFGVPHYWLLDPFRRTLDCYRLEGGDYRPDAMGHDADVVTPTLFPGPTIQLTPIWI
jgi:Uma2 family endonuclease